MEKSPRQCPTSPCGNFDEVDDFFFVETDEMDVEMDTEPETPAPTGLSNFVIPAVITALTTVASRDRLLVAHIARSVITGAATTISAGAVAGVPGLAVGALVAGGLVAFNTMKRRSAQNVIQSLDQRQQRQLTQRIRVGLRNLGIKDIAKGILQRRDVKDVALNIVSSFLTEKYGLQLTRS